MASPAFSPISRLTALATCRGNGKPPAGRRIPLALLRAPTGSRTAGADWKLEPDGVLGRVLEVNAGVTQSYPLTLDRAVTFTARARLYPHDWRDLVGAVRVVVAVTTPAGLAEPWSATLHAGDRGRPGGCPVRVVLPAETTALHLAVHPLRTPARQDPLERAIWVEPALWDSAGPPTGTPALPADQSPTMPPASHEEDGPLFSVLVPVHDPPLGMLREAVESVGGQTFGDWELCLVDDGSTDPEVVAALKAYTADPRIHLRRHERAGGISAATNEALAMARGRYIALLDHDDTLAPDALEQIATVVGADPALDMVYTDEDIVQDGIVLEPHPKPGWSPEHLTALMYTCHLGVYRRSLAQELGGFQARFDGCQDFDFVLRLSERTDRIAHVPRILYHWRAHAASTATFGGDAKPHAFLAQPAAIAAHLVRIGVTADIRPGYLPGIHRIVHRVDPGAPVGFVLAVRSTAGLAVAVESWLAQSHAAWRLVLAAPRSMHVKIGRVLSAAGLGTDRHQLLEATADAAGLARAAAHAAAEGVSDERLLILQTPATGLTSDWLTRLLGYARQPGIMAAGPVILGRDGSIAQAGVALPDGLALHLLHDLPPASAPPAVRNVSAVSGGLLTPAAAFCALGGLDPTYHELSLVDYCVRAAEAGGRILTVPDARLRISGPDPTTNDLPALRALARRWTAGGHTDDPFFNAGYLTDRGDLAMRPTT
jgi:glycosyltransferase involved in cell wall biosynthesis